MPSIHANPESKRRRPPLSGCAPALPRGLKLLTFALAMLFTACAQVDAPSSDSQLSEAVVDDDAGVLESSSDEALELAGSEQGLSGSFCWKDSYGRGAGTVPDTCDGTQKDNGLCYPWCASGYVGVGPVCWQTCPSGWRDDGTACWLDASIISADNSSCPWYDKCGLTFARGCSKCPSGYRVDGCTCRRDTQMFYKHSYGRGAGQPMQCNSSLQYDAGLCYKPCASGYAGVGPVCWGQCPASASVQCGAGCAVSSGACAEQIISQIQTTLEVAGNIGAAVVSFGGSSAAKYITKVAMTQTEKAALKAKIKQEVKEKFQDLAEYELEQLGNAAVTAAQGEPVDWSSLDPTGIAAMVNAFNAPLCSKLQ